MRQARAQLGYGRGTLDLEEADAGFLLMTPADLVKVFEDPGYKPPLLPSVALEINELTRRPLFNVDQVVKLLERDPMLASRILRTAQSPAYASRIPVRSLGEALKRLGVETVSRIVFEVSFGMTLFRAPGYDTPMNHVRLHSTAVAHVARAIALATRQPSEEAFLCGLLHDIGIVASLLVFAAFKPSPSFDEAWSVIYPVHAEISDRLAQLWKLPPQIQATLAQHHARAPSWPLAGVVQVADAIVTQLGLGLEPVIDHEELETARWRSRISDAMMPDLVKQATMLISTLT